jgi:hypothetical protein
MEFELNLRTSIIFESIQFKLQCHSNEKSRTPYSYDNRRVRDRPFALSPHDE